MILAGDIGATNSRLAFFSERSGRLEPVVEATYPSRDHTNLATIVKTFVSAHDLMIDVACFGVAGPVRHGRSDTTNLPWDVDARELAARVAAQVRRADQRPGSPRIRHRHAGSRRFCDAQPGVHWRPLGTPR